MKSPLRNSFLVLVLLFESAGLAHYQEEKTSPAEKAACEAEWLAWQRTYGGRTPFIAHNKSHPEWAYSKENIESVLKGETPTLKFTAPLVLNGKTKSPEEATKLFRLLRQTPDAKSASIASSRNHIDYLMRSPIKDEELVIVLVGGEHVSDYFLKHPRVDVHYASPKFSSSTMRFNSDYRQNTEKILRLSEGKSIPRFDIGRSGSMGMLSDLISLNQDTNLKADFILSDVEPRLTQSRIIIEDLHGVDETSVIRDLPSGSCLKALGFKKVTYVAEGVNRRSGGYQDAELATVQQLDFKPKHLAALDARIKWIEAEIEKVPSSNQAVRNRWVKDRLEPVQALRKEIESSNPEIYPIQSAMMRKLSDYRSSGMEVFLQGLDVGNAELSKQLSNWLQVKTELETAKPAEGAMNDEARERLKRELERIEKRLGR